MTNASPAQLLVVEDSDEDYKTLLRILRSLSVSIPVERCIDARECFDFLHATGKYADRQKSDMPVILLLDLNLPGTDGHAILQRIKTEPSLKSLPVVIITTSSNPKDVQTCYRNGASGYLVKIVDYETFRQTIRDFVTYWFQTVLLPLPEEIAP